MAGESLLGLLDVFATVILLFKLLSIFKDFQIVPLSQGRLVELLVQLPDSIKCFDALSYPVLLFESRIQDSDLANVPVRNLLLRRILLTEVPSQQIIIIQDLQSEQLVSLRFGTQFSNNV